MILAIRTDKPEAELYLLDRNGKQTAAQKWLADRRLSRQILLKIKQFLTKQEFTSEDLTGLIVFAGPGSFTGLRIGITVANTMAYGLDIPVVGSKSANWLKNGFKRLNGAKPGRFVVPEYGALPNITTPKK